VTDYSRDVGAVNKDTLDTVAREYLEPESVTVTSIRGRE